MTIQFIGLGFIGLPTAVIVAQKGVRVLGVDVKPVVVDAINNGQAHIFEPGLEAVLKDTVSKGTFTSSITAAQADVHLVVVPTPFKSNLEPDISFVEAATRSLIPILKHVNIYILESTSPIGTT